VILLLDLSGSVSPVLQEIRRGALGALSRLKQTDEVSLMVFSSRASCCRTSRGTGGLIVDRIGRDREDAGDRSGNLALSGAQ
jgi:hypothetical protein